MFQRQPAWVLPHGLEFSKSTRTSTREALGPRCPRTETMFCAIGFIVASLSLVHHPSGA